MFCFRKTKQQYFEQIYVDDKIKLENLFLEYFFLSKMYLYQWEQSLVLTTTINLAFQRCLVDNCKKKKKKF